MLLTACILLAGCSQGTPNGNRTPIPAPLAGLQLRLLVVADPELAAAAQRLQGEWNVQTGSELQIEQMTEKQFDALQTLDADALLCPGCQLGTLAERKLIVPLSKRLLQGAAGDWSEILELVRLHDVTWGTQTWAVPFGSPVLTCYYRADLLKKLDRRPPQTWPEYLELARLLADRKNLGTEAPAEDSAWHGAIEPLGRGWAGLVLLAWAAPYAKHRDNYSTLFSIDTMEPLVAGPPFVRAMEELAAAAKFGPAEQTIYDPAAARAAFWQGKCGMALSWPSAAAVMDTAAGRTVEVGFAELPGSAQVYNIGNQSWQTRRENEEPRVPLLAVAGRIGVVAASSSHPDAASQLLLWLSGSQGSDPISAASRATTLLRQSHLKSPQKWVEKQVPATAAAQYAATIETIFLRQQWLSAPRIPGRAEYLTALDEAVQRAVRGEQSPAQALQQAAAQWRQTTKRLGLQQQRTAYLHSLGLEP